MLTVLFLLLLPVSITNWDHPLIKATNPGLTITSLPIIVVHLNGKAQQTATLKSSCAKLDPIFKAMIPVDQGTFWPTSLWAPGWQMVANGDLLCSVTFDTKGSLGLT